MRNNLTFFYSIKCSLSTYYVLDTVFAPWVIAVIREVEKVKKERKFASGSKCGFAVLHVRVRKGLTEKVAVGQIRTCEMEP